MEKTKKIHDTQELCTKNLKYINIMHCKTKDDENTKIDRRIFINLFSFNESNYYMFLRAEIASASRINSVSVCSSFSELADRISAGTFVSYPSISIDFFSFSRLDERADRFFSSFSVSLAGSIKPENEKKILVQHFAVLQLLK